MKIDFDVTVDSGNYEMDMQYGLYTLKGTSDVTSIIAEAILKERVPVKRTHRSKVRTNLKGTFEGSYGQKFQLEVLDEALVSRLKSIGVPVFTEIISYYIHEALHIDQQEELSDDASIVISDMGDISKALIKRISNPLIGMHQISTHFGYGVTLNHKVSTLNKKPIALLNKETILNLTAAKIESPLSEIDAMITRFNSMTGNGRFMIKDTNIIVSFGFGGDVISVKKAMKKEISKNLHDNNGSDESARVFMKLTVQKMILPNNRVIKYVVRGAN